MGESWEKVGTKVGKRLRKKVGGWEKGGNGLGKVGRKLGESWEKVGKKLGKGGQSWARVGTSWETRQKELGNGCGQVGMRIKMLQTLFRHEWNGCCEGLAGLALCVFFFFFGGGAGIFRVIEYYVAFGGDCIASCGFLWFVVPNNSFQRDLETV